MILLDSNIVIYLRDPNVAQIIIDQLDNQTLDTCNIVVAEVLGYRSISEEDAKYFRQLFSTLRNYPFDEAVTRKTIEIRRSTNIALPDAILAATAVVNDLTLWTHNIDDYKKIGDLSVFDPLA
jgi:predicted nucleic acid-binding protein